MPIFTRPPQPQETRQRLLLSSVKLFHALGWPGLFLGLLIGQWRVALLGLALILVALSLDSRRMAQEFHMRTNHLMGLWALGASITEANAAMAGDPPGGASIPRPRSSEGVDSITPSEPPRQEPSSP